MGMTRAQIISDLYIHAGREEEEGMHKRALLMRAAADLLERESAPAASNNHLVRTMEFDLTDAPMMMAAMRLKSCEAMMCGHKHAKKRFGEYQETFQALIPPVVAKFEEEVWSELGQLLKTARAFRVTVEAKRWERDRSWWQDGPLVVYISGHRFAGEAGGLKCYVPRGEDEHPKALFEVLRELAPMDCEGSWDNGKEPK